MKFVYLVAVHKNPKQVRFMIDLLDSPSVSFVIHVDEKVDEAPFRVELTRSNLVFCENRQKVNWGGFSQVKATLEMIRKMFDSFDQPDYVHFISGQDMPIKPVSYVYDFFKEHKGVNFIEFTPLPKEVWPEGGMPRIIYSWDIDVRGFQACMDNYDELPMRDLLPNIKPYGGSSWWSLTGECVRKISKECVAGNQLYDFYEHTLCPDEMFFQTYLLNSAPEFQYENWNLREIDWYKRHGSPTTFKMKHFGKLKMSENLFARKFDWERHNRKTFKKITYKVASRLVKNREAGVFYSIWSKIKRWFA